MINFLYFIIPIGDNIVITVAAEIYKREKKGSCLFNQFLFDRINI